MICIVICTIAFLCCSFALSASLTESTAEAASTNTSNITAADAAGTAFVNAIDSASGKPSIVTDNLIQTPFTLVLPLFLILPWLTAYRAYFPSIKIRSSSLPNALPYAFTRLIMKSTRHHMPHPPAVMSFMIPNMIWPLRNLSTPR